MHARFFEAKYGNGISAPSASLRNQNPAVVAAVLEPAKVVQAEVVQAEVVQAEAVQASIPAPSAVVNPPLKASVHEHYYPKCSF